MLLLLISMALQKFEKISSDFMSFVKALIFSKYHFILLIVFYLEIGISIYFYTIKSKILSYLFFFLGCLNYILVIFLDDRYNKIHTLNNLLQNIYDFIPSVATIFDNNGNIYFSNSVLKKFFNTSNYTYTDIINIFKDNQKVYHVLKNFNFNTKEVIFHSLKITEDKFLKIYFGNVNAEESLKFLFILETSNNDISFESFINSFMDNIAVNSNNNVILHDNIKSFLKHIKVEENKFVELMKEKSNFYLELMKNNQKNLLHVKQISVNNQKNIKIYKISYGSNLLSNFDDARSFLGVIIVDYQFNIIECNNTFKNMMDTYFMKKNNIMSYLDVDSQNILKEFLKTSTNEYLCVNLFENRDKSYKIYSKPIENYGWYLFILENHREQELENKILHMQKISLLGQMLASVSHDFNNILMAINGFCDMLLLKIPQVDGKYFSVMQIKYNVNRAISLVNTILCTSKNNINNNNEEKETNVYETIRKLVSSVETLMGEKITISFSNKCQDALIISKIPSVYMEQILLNFLVNARDSMVEKGGNIYISLDFINVAHEISSHNFNNYFAEITITDEGTGISEENISKIFDSFFTTKSDKGGTGLGLSIVQSLVKKYKGFIKINSQINKGTTFKVYLPSYEMDNTNIDSSLLANLEDKKNTIIILEDDPSIRRLMTSSLEEINDVNIISCGSIKDVEEIYHKHENLKIDIFVSDIMITDGNGIDVVNKVLVNNQDCYLILMSGYDADYLRENIKQFKEIENNHKNFTFIHKPFEITEFLNLINVHLKYVNP